MKYLFILGRNPKLSLAEVFSYFEREEIEVLGYSINKNSLVVDIKGNLPGGVIEEFGGVISIGEILISGDLGEVIKGLDKQELYFGTKNKFNYVIWNFADKKDIDEISDYLKKRFKSEKLKTTEKKLGGLMKLQDGKIVKTVNSKVDKQYFLFQPEDEGNSISPEHNFKGGFLFGKIIGSCDYNELEERDMNKPVRRESLSISPRLAKIMINLSQVKIDETIVDPFCGVGVILFEALLKEIKVIGIDKDKHAINGAIKNLEWRGFNKLDYQLLNDDSSRIDIEKINVLVTEPDFGDILKKAPQESKAKQMIGRFERLMISVINNLKRKIHGKIVFTAPLIKVGKKRIGCNSERIFRKTGLKLSKINNIEFPIQEFREDQIVGREIFVLEK